MSTPRHFLASGATPGSGEPPLPAEARLLGRDRLLSGPQKCAPYSAGSAPKAFPSIATNHKKNPRSTLTLGELDAWIKQRQPKDDPEADDAFAREQDREPELSSTDSPVEIVNPPVVPPAPGPAPHPDEPDSRAREARGSAAIFALGILSALSLGVYRRLHPTIVGSDKIRLVVLPFKNLSGDSRQDYISAGLTEEITTQLGRLDPQDLSVIAPTSAKLVSHEAITQIGQQLHVKYVLEGSVQSVASQIRIDVRLIKTSDASYAWAQSFTRELSDFLSVESDVADTVGKQILATLPAAPAEEVNTPIGDRLYAGSRQVP